MSNEKAEIVPSIALLRWAFGLGILVDVGMFVHSGWITGLIAWAGIGLVGVVFMDRIANFIVRLPELGAVEHSLLPARQAHATRRALCSAEHRGVRGRVRSLAARHHDRGSDLLALPALHFVDA